MSSPDDLRRQFATAVRWFQDRSIVLPVTPSSRDRLFFYARYKQATCGDNALPCPSIFAPVRRAMWTAWDRQRGKTREQTMREYVERLDQEMGRFDFGRLDERQRAWRDRFVQEMDREELRRALRDNARRAAGQPAQQHDEVHAEDNAAEWLQDSKHDSDEGGLKAHIPEHDGVGEEETKERPTASPSRAPASFLTPAGSKAASARRSVRPSSPSPSSSVQPTLASVSASLSSLSSSLSLPSSTAQRVAALQTEMSALLAALAQRSAGHSNDWKAAEHRVTQRLDHIQASQDALQRRMDGGIGGEGDKQQRDHSGANSGWTTPLLVVSGVVAVGCGAWWCWRTWHSDRLRALRR